MRIIQIAKVLATTLILGLFITAPTAMQNAVAVDTITKTVTVKDRNGAPLAGAQVAFASPAGFTSTLTTNSSGQAIFTNLPISQDSVEMSVEPAIGDLLNAFGFMSSDNGDFDFTTSSTIEVNLKATTILVNLKKSNGDPAPVYTAFAYIANADYQWVVPNILRTGQFGVNIDSSINCGKSTGNWPFGWGYLDTTTGESLDTSFTLQVSNCPNRTFSLIYPLTGLAAPKSGEVHQLSSLKENFKFHIVNPAATTRLIGNDYWLEICSVDAGGYQTACTSPLRPSVGLADGTYKIKANSRNSLYASTEFTAVISNSGVTTLIKAGYPATGGSTTLTPAGGVYKFPLANPNLSGSVTKPNGDSLTVSNDGSQGVWIALLKRDSSNDWNQTGNPIWSSGSFGFGITDVGTYKIQVDPYGFDDYVSTTSPPITVTENSGIKISWNGATAASTVTRNIALAVPNVSGIFLDGSGQPVTNTNSSWTNAWLQKRSTDGIGWDWISSSQMNARGAFAFSVTEVGTYRVYIEPQGRSDIAATTLGEFVVNSGNLGSFNQNYGSVTAASPTLKIRVREVGSTTNVRFAGIELQKNDQFYSWANTQQAGMAAINLATAGTFKLIVNPTQLTPTSTRKTYEVVATAGVGGAITAAITGITPDANGITTLNLGQAQLRGTILQPDTSTTGVSGSWVTAVNKNTREEMWQYGANSRSDGSYSMSLPAGTYTLYARSPNGNTTWGNSDPIGDVIIGADGTASVSGSAQSAGLTTSSFNIHLNNPYWSGKVLPPTGSTGISNARVCLNAIISGTQFWSCVNTDSQGNWAMGKPAGFTTFGANDQLQVAENQNAQYSMASYQGLTAIEAAGFNHSGGSSVGLRLKAPNFNLRVVYGESSTAASNMWVNLNLINGGWLGGSTTDTDGYAKFYVADLTKGVGVQIDPSNNSVVSALAATTTKTYQDSDMASHVVSSLFSDTITMSVPNIRGLVTDPSSSNAAAANSWVELFDATSNQWLGGANTKSNGYFALSAPSSGSYTIRVNPNGGGLTNSTNHSYSVTTASNGTISAFTDKVTNQAVATTPYGNSVAYPLTLGTPSVVGKVVDASNVGVQNSWVIPIDSANNQLWQIGSNSRSDGSFTMAVPDGSYTIQANVPWNNSNLSSSAGCGVTIASGAITTTAGGCVLSNRQLQLQLRSPNLTVHVTNAAGTAIANAHVGLGLGAWNANAQTDSSGNAALFVDPVAINTANNGKITGAQNLWMWIDPPYGTTDVVRTQCYSGQGGTACATLPQVTPGSGTFATLTINASAPAPNTSIYVKRPDNTTSAGANAWVSLIAIIKTAGVITGKNWIAGSQTDSNGKAVFNVADTSTVFAVQIEAPWNQRDTYAGVTYDSSTVGLTWAQVNGQSFALSTPNLTIAARNIANSASINSGWISVETVNGSNVPTGWIGGYGLDQNGKVSLTLGASGRFKVTVNPGPGITGVATSCIVTTNGGAVVALVAGQCGSGALSTSTLTLPLASGNVTGVISQTGDASVKIIGAIVSAYHQGTTDAATQAVTSTDKNGAYSLQLDPAFHWDITITPVNTGSDLKKFSSKTLSDRTIGVSGTTTVSTTLDVTVA